MVKKEVKQVEPFVEWQDKDNHVHFCWKCKTIAPIIPCTKGYSHIDCGGMIGTIHEVTKEQYSSMNDTEKQELTKIIDQYYEQHKAAHAKDLAADRAKSLASRPHCPMCKSTDFSKISTGSRMASIFAFGLASSSIGKQYKCNKCGHKWWKVGMRKNRWY